MDKINDKDLEKLLEMQEHPENYSDEQIEAMLDSEDFRLLSEVKRAMAYRVSEERGVWSEELNTLLNENASSKSNNSSLHTPHSSLLKYAAIFIGAVLLAGVTFAAIRFMKERTPMPIADENTAVVVGNKVGNNGVAVEKTDTIANETIVQFDDAELGDILAAMADHYNLKLDYENEAAKSIKLFLKWDKQAEIDKALEILNSYDRIDIEHHGDVLIVK